MTIASWDKAIDMAHEGIREEMLRQVGRGEIYRSTREIWYKRLPINERTALYGYFPPIMDQVLNDILDYLLASHSIEINTFRSYCGLNPARLVGVES